ncbi:MAG: hypothetical protein ACLU0O_11890 [Collinsella sp.]
MSRRNTELLLLIASAFPVILLYAMYVLTAGAAISFETLAVPIGLLPPLPRPHCRAHLGARCRPRHPAHRIYTFGHRHHVRDASRPRLAISQLIILFVSVALMVGTLALVKTSTWSCATSTPLASSASSC